MGFGVASVLDAATVDEMSDEDATVVVAVPNVKEAVVLLNANIDSDCAAVVVVGAVVLLSPRLTGADVKIDAKEDPGAAVVVTEGEEVSAGVEELEYVIETLSARCLEVSNLCLP